MDSKVLIDSINSAKVYSEIFTNLSSWKDTYKEYMMLIHPDRCDLTGSTEATQKLTEWKTELEKGKKFVDDAGEVTYFFDRIEFSGKKELLLKSLENYKKLVSLKDEWSNKMKIYLPKSGEIIGDKLVFTLWEYGKPLCTLGTLPHDHVNWITNRMFNLVDWLCSKGFAHNGLNPNSLVVLPENHGLVCISFYHLKPIDQKLETVSALYQNFYPDSIFTKKLSTPQTDIVGVKKTAIWLLGDKSGVGIKLKKTHKRGIIDFLTRFDTDPYKAIDAHKDLVKKLFPKAFHRLTV